jgi:hypothetical protein
MLRLKYFVVDVYFIVLDVCFGPSIHAARSFDMQK